MIKLLKLFSLFGVVACLGYACATPEPVADSDDDAGELEREPFAIFDFSDDLITAYLEDLDLGDMSEEELMLYQTRSSLNDFYTRQTHDMPEFYLQEIEEEEVDIYQGFRIQIISTRDVNLADTTLAEFEAWADTAFADYSPRGYVHYRQPYYRVRVGDFHDRERAIEFSRLIKVRYPDAWIIHDRVNPYRVPADTVEFRIVDIFEEVR